MSRPNTEAPRPAAAQVDILSSRLGRSLILRFLLVGVIPLAIFAAPLYYQTRSILGAGVRTTLISYSNHAKAQIFLVLDGARARLPQLVPTDGTRSDTPVLPFRRIAMLTREEMTGDSVNAPWPALNEVQRSMLQKGETIMTAPFPVDAAMTVALLARAPDGRFIAGILEPTELWRATQAANYGPHDVFIVLDDHGRVLVSSHQDVPIGMVLFQGRLPEASRLIGEDDLPELRSGLWVFSDFWLEGAFGGGRWGVVTMRNREAVTEPLLVLFQSLMVLLLAAFCIIVILSFREARELLLPIKQVAAEARRVAEGKWDRQIEFNRLDELGELVYSFNEMIRRLAETHDERVRLTREAIVGRMAAMIAHQINTPLAAIKSRLQMLRDDNPGAGAAHDVLAGQIDRIGEIIRTLLGFARLRSQSDTPARVGEIIRNVETLFRPSIEEHGIRCHVTSMADPPNVECAADDLQEILINLIENAREATLARLARRRGGDATERAEAPGIRIVTARDAETFILTVEDDGEGLENPERIFDPFYTTKTTGTGLGLAICRRIAESCGGSIQAENRPEGGARFTVRLPIKDANRSTNYVSSDTGFQ
jgi:two-component system sensor histidine kinase AtoS